MSTSSFPRILVVSHAVCSDTTNTGITIASFLKGWDSRAVAQLYFYNETPMSPLSDRYYRITDFEAARSAFTRVPCGREVFQETPAPKLAQTVSSSLPFQQRVYAFGRKKHSLTVLGRDLIWWMARWRTPELERWIDDFAPNLIFLVAGEYHFAYHIAQYIARSRRIPMMVFIGDDVYNISKSSFSLFFWLEKWLIRRTVRETLQTTERFIAAHAMMGEEYHRLFGVQYTVIPKGCTAFAPSIQVREQEPLRIAYLGNVLSFKRWTTLRKIGEALAAINQHGAKARLELYSIEHLSPRMLEHLTIANAMTFNGALDAAGVQRVLAEADILLHVESMDSVNRRLVRLSFSTKIPDYLGSGKCLLAVGPAEVASVKIIHDRQLGMTISDFTQLEPLLTQLIDNPALRREFALRALQEAHLEYDAEVNAHRFADAVYSVTADK